MSDVNFSSEQSSIPADESADWIEALASGGLRLRHSPAALVQREGEVLPLMLALLAAYAVFWLMVALSPAIRGALLQAGLSTALQFQLLIFWLLTGGALILLLRRRAQRWKQEQVLIVDRMLDLQRVTLWGQSQQQALLTQVRFDFYLRRETRQAQSGPRQRWVQELRVVLPDTAPFIVWAALDRFSAEDSPTPALPEFSLQRLADVSQKTVNWAIEAGDSKEKRRGVISPTAFV